MTNIKDVIKSFEKINIPISYIKHSKDIVLPFAVYYEIEAENFIADDSVFNSDYNYNIEYYFDKKNKAKEKEIERAFNSLEIVWTRSRDTFIESENMYMILYEI